MKNKLKCILLVDDDEATNFINKMVLDRSNIAEHIEVTWNGREALDYLTCQGKYESNANNYPQPSLIFLDINMPRMDGWEFMDEYSKLADYQKGGIVIIMLTTSLNPDDKNKAENIKDISEFKNKPLNYGTVDGIMKKYYPNMI